MSAGDITPGRRVCRKDVHPPDLEPGEYHWDGDKIIWARLPNGELVRIDERWQIVLDTNGGTITLAPPPGEDNCSILVEGEHGRWHGFLEHGVWREVE